MSFVTNVIKDFGSIIAHNRIIYLYIILLWRKNASPNQKMLMTIVTMTIMTFYYVLLF